MFNIYDIHNDIAMMMPQAQDGFVFNLLWKYNEKLLRYYQSNTSKSMKHDSIDVPLLAENKITVTSPKFNDNSSEASISFNGK